MADLSYIHLKRAIDLSFSAVLLICLSPLILLISLSILITMGSPVFFTQERIGKGNKAFVIYKFRTMREKDIRHQTDESRITWSGKLLRLFRLDELPQLLNIFLGDMSFIGPRPLLPRYLDYYTDEEKKRHLVRPGLSGYGQISDLNYPKWEDQFRNDLYYVNNLSLKLDAYIFYKTLLKIVLPGSMSGTGVSGSDGRPNFDIYRQNQMRQDDVKSGQPENKKES